jgi:hypothetical protein
VIYPNPASDKIILHGLKTDSESQYEITGLDGKSMQQGVFNGLPIDIASLPEGIRVDSASERFMKKFVISR